MPYVFTQGIFFIFLLEITKVLFKFVRVTNKGLTKRSTIMKKLEKMMQEGINENDLKKVAWALNLGLNINGVLNDGMPSLHWAVRKNNIQLTELLISVGADVDAKGNDGSSPLAWAVSRGRIALVKLLISLGADVNAKNEWGWSSLDYARSEEMKELLQGVTP